MIEERAMVIKSEGEYAWIQAGLGPSCGQCSESGGCHGGLLGRAFGPRMVRVRVHNPIQAKVGEEVVVGIGEGALIGSSLLLYLVPLVGLMTAAALVEVLLGDAVTPPRDLFTVLAGVLGFLVSLALVRHASVRWQPEYGLEPILLRRVRNASPNSVGVRR